MPEMTLLRNNPPQSLAQPMRQAYDYWQEVPWHKRKNRRKQAFLLQNYQHARKDLQGSLCLACPPSRGSSPLLPVCKSYQQRKKRPSCGVYPPPRGAGSRYYPYAKVISGARSDLRAACTPPPTRGSSRYYPYAKVINSARDPLPGPLQRF